MPKLSLNNISSGYASNTAHNTNNDLIEAAVENTLSRDGTTPNQMGADLDMNGHHILNAAGISTTGDGSFTGANIHAATNKVTPVNADEFPISDSAASWGLKRLSWSNIKTALAGLFAASGANTDITSLAAPALGAATATTQSSTDNTTKVATTAQVQSALLYYTNNYSPEVRQTVLYGPVDSSGFPSFGGSTGSTSVITSGTLTATCAAGGIVNYLGSITNPTWTSLSTNGTMYLYLDITSAGVVTTGSTTLAPVYQWGGTYSTTNDQNTFNIQEMTMKVGNGATVTQVYRVFAGEVTVAGGVVTAITWYALMGRYDSGYTATLPSLNTTVTKTHNLGVTIGVEVREVIECTTADIGFSIGDIVDHGLADWDTVRVWDHIYWKTSLSCGFHTFGTSGGGQVAYYLLRKDTGLAAGLTLASWKYKMTAKRNW